MSQQKKLHKIVWSEENINNYWELNETEDGLKSKFLPGEFYENLIRYVRRFVQGKKKVLDIGTGVGTLSNLLFEKGFEVYGIDVSEKGITILKDKFIKENRNIVLKTGPIFNIPFESNYFDCVFATEVLEHILPQKLKESVAEVKRVLKTDGKFIITVPYKEEIQMAVCPECYCQFPVNQHLNSFDEEKMRNLLTEAGFNISFCKLVPKIPLSGHLLKDTTKKIIAFLEKRIISLMYGSIFITVASKSE